jgi:hypothetical protein
MSDYPDKDFPWNFYFNGELMPKWGACWGTTHIKKFLQPDKDACEDISDRDIFIIYCKIDHVGIVESAEPEVFLYAIQEVLYLLLLNKDKSLANIAEHYPSPNEIYNGVIEAGFRMRQLVVERGCAFWTSGYEKDCLELKEAIRRSKLPTDSPDYLLPPHISQMRSFLRICHKHQMSKLHELAQSGRFGKDLRKQLHDLK